MVDPTPAVSSPRFYSYSHKSRVIIELAPHVDYQVLSQQDDKLWVRFFGGRCLRREYIPVKDDVVTSIELQPHSHSTDLMITLGASASVAIMGLEESPRALVVDIPVRGMVEVESLPILEIPKISTPTPSLVSKTLPTSKKPPAPRLSATLKMIPATGVSALPVSVPPQAGIPKITWASTPPVPSPSSALMSLSPIRTIVIDAGHGGKDPGAVGSYGTKEKDINLEVAKSLERLLTREGRFTVILTRQDDTFIPLDERADIANRHKADLFISIHCNAALSPKSNGFEIYFLSEKATDDDAAAVARRENAVVELEGITGKAKHKLQELLWSLARTETLNESSEIAAFMARQVGSRLPLVNRGVRQAGFFVLKGADMPAVLVESAFLSNPGEEGLLKSARYRTQLTDALYAGLLDYEKRKIKTRLEK
jgi:N-acetylmuramoyl-L-alanine amidase